MREVIFAARIQNHKPMIQFALRFCLALGFSLAVPIASKAQAILRGTVSFLNSGSRPAVGVDISAFGANTRVTTNAGMFELVFSDKKPGDKVKIIVGSKDRDGTNLELVNDKVIAQVRVPSKPDDDIVEIIICKVGQRNEAALRYNGIIVKTINENTEKRLRAIDEKLSAAKIDAETIVSLQNEKEKLAAERDSALAKAEEQALYIASINLDKANQLVREAVLKVDSLQDIPGAIAVLDNEMLYQAYLEASEKKKKAEAEIRQVVTGFEFKINLLKPLYRYGEIAECYEKIAGIYEREDYDKEQLATNFNEAAVYWEFNGDYQNALEFNLKALAIREKSLPADHSDLAESYNNLAVTYGDLSEHQKQLEFNMKALAVWGKVLPDDHPKLATSYTNLATTYIYLGDYQNALEFNLKALAIQEKVLPAEHPDLATTYNNLAVTYGDLGEHQKQLEFNIKALAVWEKALPADHPDLAKLYNNLAMTYYHLGDHQKALEFNLKALAIQEKVLSADHPDLAMSYNNLAATYGEIGEHQKELQFEMKALTIWEKALPADHPDLAKLYNNLALTYFSLKNYNQSILFYEKALFIWRKKLLAHDPELKNIETNFLYLYKKRADDYRIKQEYDKAVSDYDFVIKAQNDGNALNSRGLCHFYLKNYDQAIFDYQNAAKYDSTLALTTYLNNVGTAYVKKGDFSHARDAFEAFEKLEPQNGRVFRNWAMYYALQNDKTRAIENLQKAVSLDYKDLKWITTDDSLENIRGEQGYKDLVEQLKKQ